MSTNDGTSPVFHRIAACLLRASLFFNRCLHNRVEQDAAFKPTIPRINDAESICQNPEDLACVHSSYFPSLFCPSTVPKSVASTSVLGKRADDL